MANIILKDKDGIPVTHNGITQLEVAGTDKAHKYTQLSVLRAYIVSQVGESNGIAQYKVMRQLQFLPSEDCFAFAITDTDCKEFGAKQSDGSYVVSQFLTPKSLTVGNTYLATEMY